MSRWWIPAKRQTGGRLKRVTHHLDPDEPFFFTYGDGVADIDIHKLLAFHRSHGGKATISAGVAAGTPARCSWKGRA